MIDVDIDSVYRVCKDKIKETHATTNYFKNKRYFTYSISNFGSLTLLSNLLLNLEDIGLKNHIVFSLDKRTHNILLSKNISSILIEIDIENSNKYYGYTSKKYFKILSYKTIIMICMIEFGAEQKVDTCYFDTDVVFTKDPYDYINTTDYDLYIQQSYINNKSKIYEDDYIRTLCDTGIVYTRHNSEAHVWYKKILPILVAGEDSYLVNGDALAFVEVLLGNKDKITVSTCYKNNKKDEFFNVKILDQELFLIGHTIRHRSGLLERMLSGEHKYIMAHANSVPQKIMKILILKKIGKWYI